MQPTKGDEWTKLPRATSSQHRPHYCSCDSKNYCPLAFDRVLALRLGVFTWIGQGRGRTGGTGARAARSGTIGFVAKGTARGRRGPLLRLHQMVELVPGCNAQRRKGDKVEKRREEEVWP